MNNEAGFPVKTTLDTRKETVDLRLKQKGGSHQSAGRKLKAKALGAKSPQVGVSMTPWGYSDTYGV